MKKLGLVGGMEPESTIPFITISCMAYKKNREIKYFPF